MQRGATFFPYYDHNLYPGIIRAPMNAIEQSQIEAGHGLPRPAKGRPKMNNEQEASCPN